MPEPYEELLSIADSMDELAERGRHEDVQWPLEGLEQAAKEIGLAFSGSWLGYHASVYYKDLKPPPLGDHFSQELGPTGNWIEFDPVYVSKAIYELADNPDMEPARKFHNEDAGEFSTQRLNAISILEVALNDSDESFLERMKGDIDSLSVMTVNEVIARLQPKTAISTDIYALTQGDQIAPPHIGVLAEVRVSRDALRVVAELGRLTRQAAEHILRVIQRQQQQREATEIAGTKVFIGHGRSPIWRELKDFLKDRLGLQVEEFNSVPTAGRATKERLLEMMDEAAFAFLVMTGDDEFRVVTGEDGQPDTRLYPRLNVVHEAGLFQGRLGFERAIVLLEEGCEEFSNIEGVTQIRFPRNDISAKSEEIRRVLEREGLLSGDG